MGGGGGGVGGGEKAAVPVSKNGISTDPTLPLIVNVSDSDSAVNAEPFS